MILSQVANLGEMFKIETDELVTRTKLQDIVDDQSFIVFQPTVHGIPLRANKSKPLTFSFFRDNGLFVFEAVLEKSFTRDNLRVCQFRTVTPIKKQQRRSSYRLPVVLDVKVSHLQPEVDVPEEVEEYAGKSSDISDSGIQFSCYEYFLSGTLLKVNVKLDEDDEITLEGKVVRCYTPSEKTNKYSVSVQFVNLSSNSQTRLSKFILRTQIKNRNRLK